MLDETTATETLRAAGMRLTPQRRALIDALSGNRSHPAAEEVALAVAERLPGVSLSTVYKALHEFAELGLVLELDTPGAMRFDPDVSEHAHLVCSRCGRVSDVALPPSVLASLTGSVAPGEASVHRVEVMLHGTCRSCASA